MRTLFVHQNFPAQFKHLAPALAAMPGHEVLALTDAASQRPEIVKTARYTFTPPDKDAIPLLGRNYTWRAARGEAVALAANELKANGFVPDVIFGHPGWGETLFLKEVFPDAKLVVYAESYYSGPGSSVGFDPEFGGLELNERLAARSRNAAQLAALDVADRGLTPTEWQRAQFPLEWRQKIEVIHDGIDTTVIKPDRSMAMMVNQTQKLKFGDEVITFINRTLEPSRGYHIFMRALPKILKARPNATVLIIGDVGSSYGPVAPAGKNWRQMFFDEVKDAIDQTRVHFLGRIPYVDFLSIMKLSSVHVYFTYPTVLSWSTLEAMATECLVVGSATTPVQEVIEDGKNGFLVDFFDVAGLAGRVIACLEAGRALDGLRKAARKTVVDRFDLKSICLPQQLALIERLRTQT